MNDRLDDDALRRRLASLDSDLFATQLPGPAAARRRAAQRTRHQVTGGILAGVAAIAVGVVAISPPDFTTTAPDPAPPAGTSEPTPSEPTAAEDDLGDALLTPDDLAGDTGTAWIESRDAATAVSCDPIAVVEAMSSVVARDGVTLEAPGIGQVRQELVRFGSDIDLGALFDEVISCLPDSGSGELPQVVDTLQIVDVGDEGWLVRYYADPRDQRADAVTIAMTRSGDVVSVTVRTEPTENTTGDIDLNTPIVATERLCEVLFGTDCVGDPSTVDLAGSETEPTGDPTVDEPEPSDGPTGEPSDPTGEADESPDPELLDLAEDPFLTDDDVATVGTATGFFRSPESTETTAHQAPCLQDLTAAGADTVAELGYGHDLDASLAEWALRMPDADSAFRLVAAHTVLPDVCGEVGEDREQTVGDPVALEVDGADDAVVWTVESVPTAENAGSSTSFAGIGIARTANIVVVVSFAAMSDPADGDWPSVAAGLLTTALERAVG